MQKFIESRLYYKKKKMKLKAQLLVPFPLFKYSYWVAIIHLRNIVLLTVNVGLKK
jgi:hypothetical protein